MDTIRESNSNDCNQAINSMVTLQSAIASTSMIHSNLSRCIIQSRELSGLLSEYEAELVVPKRLRSVSEGLRTDVEQI
jgi:hypothetical protein